MQNDRALEQVQTINGVKYYLYRDTKSSRTWWARVLGTDGIEQNLGEHLFTLDLKKIYNLFKDYPKALTKEEKEIFDRENPFWQEFFSDRK
ncbi:MAG: hypothetical protein LIO41_04200 [Ruminococcus sp.]|nr:hypothetical protein [Ruminococcus sp.]